jgi:lactate dehydrogenase-like 2-hydroxyacid dehydrogenase
MAPKKPRIFITRALPSAVLERANGDYDATINYDDSVLGGDALIAASQSMDGLLICSSEQMTAAVIAGLADSVRIIATFSVGYEHIDVAAANARNIVVTNTPDVVTDATADQAMTLMLGAARRAAEADVMVRAGRWHGWTPTHMLGTHITGKRMGIVGAAGTRLRYENPLSQPHALGSGARSRRDLPRRRRKPVGGQRLFVPALPGNAGDQQAVG